MYCVGGASVTNEFLGGTHRKTESSKMHINRFNELNGLAIRAITLLSPTIAFVTFICSSTVAASTIATSTIATEELPNVFGFEM